MHLDYKTVVHSSFPASFFDTFSTAALKYIMTPHCDMSTQWLDTHSCSLRRRKVCTQAWFSVARSGPGYSHQKATNRFRPDRDMQPDRKKKISAIIDLTLLVPMPSRPAWPRLAWPGRSSTLSEPSQACPIPRPPTRSKSVG